MQDKRFILVVQQQTNTMHRLKEIAWDESNYLLFFVIFYKKD